MFSDNRGRTLLLPLMATTVMSGGPAGRSRPESVGERLPDATALDGREFCLRPVDENDAQFILDLRRSDRARGHLHPIPEGLDQQRSWIRSQRQSVGDHYFTIRERVGHAAVGLIGLYGIDASASVGEWGRWIIRDGVPAAPESLLLVLKFGFEGLGLRRIVSHTLATNRSVIAFHQSLGLGDGESRPGFFDFDGVRVDAVEHSITVESWSDVRGRLMRASAGIADAMARKRSLQRSRGD